MKATPGHNIAYVFDFDDTIVKTSSKIKIFRNGAFHSALSSEQFKSYKKHPADTLDFSEFTDKDKILSAKPYKMWSVLKNISKAIKEGKSKSDIYILTARHPVTKSYIYALLTKNDIKINIDNIYTVGDSSGKDISNEKMIVLNKIDDQYERVVFFDDDKKNISKVSHIDTIEKRLVEMDGVAPDNFSTPMNTPGMGNAEINTDTMIGSGDIWGNDNKLKSKKKKRKHKIITLKKYLQK